MTKRYCVESPTLCPFASGVVVGPNCVIFAGCRLHVSISHHKAAIIAQLRDPQRVGILVQRVTGKRHLKTVGRVPLGKQSKGHLRLRWNLRVNGKKLHAGRYRVTLRALDKHRNVLGLTKPVTIRVR